MRRIDGIYHPGVVARHPKSGRWQLATAKINGGSQMIYFGEDGFSLEHRIKTLPLTWYETL